MNSYRLTGGDKPRPYVRKLIYQLAGGDKPRLYVGKLIYLLAGGELNSI